MPSPTIWKAVFFSLIILSFVLAGPPAEAVDKKPNILVIMGDDIGWFNPSAYHQGIMGYQTPEHRPDCAGRREVHRLVRPAELHGRARGVRHRPVAHPHRADESRPAGADIGLQAEDPSVAEVLKPLGYATGQFGKNHLGDKDEFLPTNHGFDEFFGNLYHLNAEEEPENPDYPKNPEFRKRFGPRGVHPLLRRRQDRGHRPADAQAHGDGGRGVPRRRARLHRPPAQGREAVLLLLQQHPDAHLHAPEEGERGQDGPRPLPRRHGRARRARRASC